MPISFSDRLVQINHLLARGFLGWSFHTGMLFAATATWWGARRPRPSPHEGLDLQAFVRAEGGRGFLAAGEAIPVPLPGRVVAIFADFVGQSIMVAHDDGWGGGQLHTILAHVLPEPGLVVGKRCPTGEVIARIAPGRRAGAPPHLHLTALALAGPLPAAVSWPMLTTSPSICLIDPMTVVDLGLTPPS